MFSDLAEKNFSIEQVDLFQSPSGDSLFSDEESRAERTSAAAAFQSPSGDSLFSDDNKKPAFAGKHQRFNPLAGIRCFLTADVSAILNAPEADMFQSPSGDSLFSDGIETNSFAGSDDGFNPLAGIRCFLTPLNICFLQHLQVIGFNPLAGIRCFLTAYDILSLISRYLVGFNPLAGIRCFLTNTGSKIENDLLKSFNPLAGIRCFLTAILCNTPCCIAGFQSPSGDSLFSDKIRRSAKMNIYSIVSIP